MRTRTKLKPGQKGTKELVEKYGDALYCVRYRYDKEKRKQFKTAEIIVSESDWTPPPDKHPASALVPLRIGITEKDLQEQARAVGGHWDREKHVWFVRYGCIAGTKLEKFIIVETPKGDIK